VTAEDPSALAGAMAEFFEHQEGPRMESTLSERGEPSAWDGLAARVAAIALGETPIPGGPGDRGEPIETTSIRDGSRSDRTATAPDDGRQIDVRA
jgi:hypothetical protein